MRDNIANNESVSSPDPLFSHKVRASGGNSNNSGSKRGKKKKNTKILQPEGFKTYLDYDHPEPKPKKAKKKVMVSKKTLREAE